MEVALKVPANVENVVVENTPGWTTRVVRAGGRIDVIRFTGGSIAPDFFASFRLIARNPVEEGELVWAVTQRYAGGEVVGWTGPPDSDTPAPRTQVTESAPATDVLDLAEGSTGGETETGTETETTPTATAAEPSAAAESDDEGSDTLLLVVSVAALLVGLTALAVALRGRRHLTLCGGRRPPDRRPRAQRSATAGSRSTRRRRSSSPRPRRSWCP